ARRRGRGPQRRGGRPRAAPATAPARRASARNHSARPPPLSRAAGERGWALLPHRVDAAVDVDDLTGGRGEPVRKERGDGAGGGFGVVDVPPEWGPVRPGALHLGESRNRLRRGGADRPGGDEVAPDPGRPQVAGEVAVRRF